MTFVDSHCHLDFEEFDEDREDVISAAMGSGVSRFVIPGIKQTHWSRQVALRAKYANCHLAFGIHPWFLEDFKWSDMDVLREFLLEQKPVAVGECGIDAVIDNIPKQIEVFTAQVELANELTLPLIVHHRRSHHHILSVFKQIRPRYGGIIHAFSGSFQDADKYIKLGFKLGCGGGITYPRAEKTKQVFRRVELEHIVLETDSPTMPLHGFQGERNDPSKIVNVATELAELKKVPLSEIAKITTQNLAGLVLTG